jgi:hypothetical protein
MGAIIRDQRIGDKGISPVKNQGSDGYVHLNPVFIG